MSGWSRRCFPITRPFIIPRTVQAGWPDSQPYYKSREFSLGATLFFFFLTYSVTLLIRLLEIPYWDNASYKLGNEFLLATHDAYHWVAGADGFEFGAGHPMSALLLFISNLLGSSLANTAFWLPAFLGSLTALAVYLWGAGLGYPLAGMCAGILSALSPSFFARTMLGFYDTDLIVLLFTILLGLVPALWLHPWLSNIPDLISEKIYKNRKKKEDKPGYLGRTNQWYSASCQNLELVPREIEEDILSWKWLLALILSGLFGYYTQDWHSLFPYLVRYSALIMPLLIMVFGPVQGRIFLLQGAFCHALPLLTGPIGLLAAMLYTLFLKVSLKDFFKEILESHEDSDWEGHREGHREGHEDSDWEGHREGHREGYEDSDWEGHREKNLESHGEYCWKTKLQKEIRIILYNTLFFIKYMLNQKFFLLILWGLIVFLALDTYTLEIMRKSFSSYVFRSGDIVLAAKELIFPSVSQSIIEIQTVSLDQLISYIYPVRTIVFLSIAAILTALIFTPVLLWFLPLLALSFLSLYMGGRMSMFGAPVLMLALCIEGSLFFKLLWKFILSLYRKFFKRDESQSINRWDFFPEYKSVRFIFSLVASLALVWPLLSLIPLYTQGPIISKDHAEGLSYLKTNSPADSIVWNWWDWGYATHHFARRLTIADGARHGGAALYLPALVYATDDPRFARQIIKYTATKDNKPAAVFAGLTASEVNELLKKLKDKNSELIVNEKKQYLLVSFELLRLGLWITRYGTWSFETEKSNGAIMNNIYQSLEIDVQEGWVATESKQRVNASSIDIFSTAGLERFDFPKRQGNHFIFNTYTHSAAVAVSKKSNSKLVKFWELQRGAFSFNSPSNDKMAMDPKFYNSVMVQLLLSKEDDPRLAPYFKCVFTNSYTRVYEVL